MHSFIVRKASPEGYPLSSIRCIKRVARKSQLEVCERRGKSFIRYFKGPIIKVLRRNTPYGNIIYMLRLLENDRKTSFLMACSRLSDSGEDAKEKGTRKVPFYFRVCAFSIQRTRLSRSLQQATFLTDLFSRSRYMKRVQLFNGRYTKGVPFVKNGIYKGKGLEPSSQLYDFYQWAIWWKMYHLMELKT